jgi:hypothetical protein
MVDDLSSFAVLIGTEQLRAAVSLTARQADPERRAFVDAGGHGNAVAMATGGGADSSDVGGPEL